MNQDRSKKRVVELGIGRPKSYLRERRSGGKREGLRKVPRKKFFILLSLLMGGQKPKIKGGGTISATVDRRQKKGNETMQEGGKE